MTEQEIKITIATADLARKLPANKREYLLGFIEGMATAAQNDQAERQPA